MKRIFLVAAIVISAFLLSVVKAEEVKYQKEKLVAQNMVDEAVKLIQDKGQEAIGIIEEKNGKFDKNNIYVFVTSESGADLVNPAFQEVEGLPVDAYSNQAAKMAQMTIVNAVKDKDTAWVEYLWPKPGETTPSPKISYLKKIIINGKVRIVGAGFYPEK